MARFDDPSLLPGSGETPGESFSRALPLAGTAGEAYVEGRGIPRAVADDAGVRYAGDFAGRPALLVALRNREGELRSVHGRYLQTRRGEEKMLTVGLGGGAVGVRGGWRAEPLVLVEGLFDALSLAACGCPALATVGRWAPWLPAAAAGRRVWLAFDAGRPGEKEVLHYRRQLAASRVRRLPPPLRCQDWNTALVKRGPCALRTWLGERLAEEGETLP